MDEIRIEDYYGLAISIVNERYKKLAEITGVEREDLIQEALLGLVEAKNRFEPNKGAKFITYAFWRIEGTITDYLRKLDYLPQQKREKLKRYEQVKGELIQRLDREPTLKEIAERLGVSEEEVKEIERLHLVLISLEDPIFTDDEDGVNLIDTIPSKIESPDITLRKIELAMALNLSIEKLPPIENEIIKQRYYEQKTLKDVAEFLNMPLSTIQRKEKEAEKRLKDCMEKRDGNYQISLNSNSNFDTTWVKKEKDYRH